MDEDNKLPDRDRDKAGGSSVLGKRGGLYDSVKMSVGQANRLAVGVLALLVTITILIVAFGRTGFAVTFDANGGTDVQSVKVMYGDALPDVEQPYREGYDFTGWYRDPACSELWDAGEDTVTDNITLYAGWQKTQPQ